MALAMRRAAARAAAAAAAAAARARAAASGSTSALASASASADGSGAGGAGPTAASDFARVERTERRRERAGTAGPRRRVGGRRGDSVDPFAARGRGGRTPAPEKQQDDARDELGFRRDGPDAWVSRMVNTDTHAPLEPARPAPPPAEWTAPGVDAANAVYLLPRDLSAALPEGLPRPLLREIEACGDSDAARGVLVRAPLLELMGTLDAAQRLPAGGLAAAERAPAGLTPGEAAAFEAAAARATSGRHVQLDGARASGKSVALALLVHWARANGWLAMYVPDASVITRGRVGPKPLGYVARAPGDDSTLGWDSPDVAAEMLRHMVDAHADELAELPVTDVTAGVAGAPEAKTLLELCEKGIEAEVAHATGSVVALRAELGRVTKYPVLVAVDSANALYADSAFVEPSRKLDKLRPIHASELRLARAFGAGSYEPAWDTPFAAGGDAAAPGMLGDFSWAEVARGSVVSALTHSSHGVSPKAIKPPARLGARVQMPRYTLPECKALLSYWGAAGISRRVDADEALKLRALTNGNGAELRTVARSL